MSMFDDVGEFHEKMNLPTSSIREPQFVSEGEFNFRTAFLFEEKRELIEGFAERDLAKVADALADLVWVALGTAHYFGIPFNEVWEEVRRANMAKRPWQEGDPLKPRNVVGLEVVKPLGWRPPDIDACLQLAFDRLNPMRKV